MKLLLSKEGIFPVTRDKDGNRLEDLPKTGMNLSGTVQGEGKLCGVPSLFIRLAGCNLRCIWDKGSGEFSMCDTPHAAFDTVNSRMWSIVDIVSVVKHNIGDVRHVVITGGEPLLQAGPLAVLCKHLKTELDVHLTLETNGTLFDDDVSSWIDLFSISPKLSSSIPDKEKLRFFNLKESGFYSSHNKKRIDIEVLQKYINLCNSGDKDIQFKFVVCSKDEDKEIKSDFLSKLTGWDKENILVMPLGAGTEELRRFTPVALEMAISNGWRFSPRMHIDLFKESVGV